MDSRAHLSCSSRLCNQGGLEPGSGRHGGSRTWTRAGRACWIRSKHFAQPVCRAVHGTGSMYPASLTGTALERCGAARKGGHCRGHPNGAARGPPRPGRPYTRHRDDPRGARPGPNTEAAQARSAVSLHHDTGKPGGRTLNRHPPFTNIMLPTRGGDLDTRRGTRRLCVEEEQWQDDSDEAEDKQREQEEQMGRKKRQRHRRRRRRGQRHNSPRRRSSDI